MQEIILVVSDATPSYYAAVRAEPGVLMAHMPDLQDADAGRVLGAKLTDADTVLFVDADHPVQAKKLARFLWEASERLDVALNDVTSRLGMFHERHHLFQLAEFLNTSLNRQDLRANTMSTMPFALSRRALDTLGNSGLAMPAKAHATAVMAGLKIGTAGSVSIRTPAEIDGDAAAAWHKTAGDHAEAWRGALSAKGNRLVFPDQVRNRKVMEELAQ